MGTVFREGFYIFFNYINIKLKKKNMGKTN